MKHTSSSPHVLYTAEINAYTIIVRIISAAEEAQALLHLGEFQIMPGEAAH